MSERTYKKALAKVKKKYPEANERFIEQKVQKKLLVRLLIVSGVSFVISLVAVILLSNLDSFMNPNAEEYETVEAILQLVGGGGSIFSVCYFAKGIHDPLTPNE